MRTIAAILTAEDDGDSDSIRSSQDLFPPFFHAVAAALNPKVFVATPSKKGWRDTGSQWQTNHVTVNLVQHPLPGGCADAVLWRFVERTRFSPGGPVYYYKGQHHDIGFPPGLQRRGYGGQITAAFVAGFKAIGLPCASVHAPTNSEYWKHMNEKFNGFFTNV